MKPIYHYSDYRKYLRDYYEDQKKTIPAFSHRMLARRAGFSAPNFIPWLFKASEDSTEIPAIKYPRQLATPSASRTILKRLCIFRSQKRAGKKRSISSV